MIVELMLDLIIPNGFIIVESKFICTMKNQTEDDGLIFFFLHSHINYIFEASASIFFFRVARNLSG